MSGLVTTTTADSAALSHEQQEELRARVEQARFFDLPARTESEQWPDAFNYAVTVEEDRRSHTVILGEDVLPEAVRALISWLDALPSREERIGPPAGA